MVENKDEKPVEGVADTDPMNGMDIPVADDSTDVDDTVSTVSTTNYFADDEIALEERDFAAFKQMEGIASWEIVGLYDADGKQLSANAVRADPPVLRVSSDDGNEAEFLLTREFATSLSRAVDDVRRSHAGMTVKRGVSRTKQSFAENLDEFMNDVKIHPVKYSFLLIFIILVMVAIGTSML